MLVDTIKFIMKMLFLSTIVLLIIYSYENKLSAKEISCKQQIEQHQQEIISLKNKIKLLTNYVVTVTYYVPSLGGINSWGDKNKTAIMDKPIPGKTCAVSRDLVHLLYKEIYISGKGIFYVNDLLADSYLGNLIRKQVDICVGSTKDIPRQGIFRNVPIAVNFN